MRRLIVVAGVLGFLVSCKQKSTHSFTVEGKIENLNAKMVYMDEILLDAGVSKPVDSATVKPDGSFQMITDIEGENLYYLRTDSKQYPFGSLVSDMNKIKITGDMAKGSQSLFYGGSPSTDALKKFFLFNNQAMEELDSIGKLGDSLSRMGATDSVLTGLRGAQDAIAQRVRTQIDSLASGNYSPIVPVLALQFNQRLYNPEDYGQVLKKLSETFKNDKHVLAASKRYQDLMAQQTQQNPGAKGPLFTGKPAPEIALNDLNGKAVTLSSYKGKYVLVDFWASWCGPCRQENPNVVAAYNKYRSKNFIVLGVSVDEDEKAWKKAIEKDKLSWTQLIDKQGMAANSYQVNAIPFNVLVNPEGVVIAENLRGSMLEDKLKEVLK